ncbi:hypothetical protein TNCV_1132801 [Trichonephila clavipes]|nr:hypothetical protein TNCV_1132801 [Trichonephila clavipes]
MAVHMTGAVKATVLQLGALQWHELTQRSIVKALSMYVWQTMRQLAVYIRVSEGRFDLGTFGSEHEYLSHHSKMIVLAWRLLLVYIDTTPPHYLHASDSANRRTNDTLFVPSVRAVSSVCMRQLRGLRHLYTKISAKRQPSSHGHGFMCHEFEPGTTKDTRCRDIDAR